MIINIQKYNIVCHMSYKILGWGEHLVIITIKIRYILKLVQKYYKKLYKITKNMYKLKCD